MNIKKREMFKQFMNEKYADYYNLQRIFTKLKGLIPV